MPPCWGPTCAVLAVASPPVLAWAGCSLSPRTPRPLCHLGPPRCRCSCRRGSMSPRPTGRGQGREERAAVGWPGGEDRRGVAGREVAGWLPPWLQLCLRLAKVADTCAASIGGVGTGVHRWCGHGGMLWPTRAGRRMPARRGLKREGQTCAFCSFPVQIALSSGDCSFGALPGQGDTSCPLALRTAGKADQRGLLGCPALDRAAWMLGGNSALTALAWPPEPSRFCSPSCVQTRASCISVLPRPQSLQPPPLCSLPRNPAQLRTLLG